MKKHFFLLAAFALLTIACQKENQDLRQIFEIAALPNASAVTYRDPNLNIVKPLGYSADIQWLAVPDAFGYYLTVERTGNSPLQIFSLLTTNEVLETNVAGLIQNKEYRARLAAYSKEGVELAAFETTFNSGQSPVPLPAYLKSRREGLTGFISWAVVPKASGYRVQIERIDSPVVLVCDVCVVGTAYQFSSIGRAEEYRYRLASIKNGVEGGWSIWVTLGSDLYNGPLPWPTQKEVTR